MNAFQAARADLNWEANSGRVIAEIGEVGEVWHRTTGAMSDDALRLAAAQERLTRTIARSGPESTAAKNATLAYRRELAALTQEERAAAAAAALAARQRAAEAAQMRNTIAAARTVGHALTTYVTAPTLLAGFYAEKLAINFNTSMARIEGLVGASREQVKQWSSDILELAPKVNKSPQELAEALYYVTSSGVDLSKALDVLTVSAKASAAGLGETQTIANLLTSVMLAYKDSNLSAADAANVLVSATKAGKLEASDLAEHLGNVLPLASRLGVSFAEVAAAVEAFSITGTDADTGVTNLSQFLSSLIKVAPQSARELAKVGLSGEQLRTELREKGLLATLHTLEDRFGGNITAIARVFPNIRALRGELALTGPQAGKVAEVFHATAQSAGEMDRAFNVAAGQDGFKIGQAIQKLRGDLIKLGDDVAPGVIAVADGIGAIADALGKLPKSAKTEIGVLVALLAVGGPLLLGIAATVKAVETIGLAFKKIPVDAAPAVAATEAELASLRVAATATGAAVGTEVSAGVGAGTAAAIGRVAALRLALLGLGGLAIAPIVIPIVYKVIQSLLTPETNVTPVAPGTAGGGAQGGTVFQRNGKWYQTLVGGKSGAVTVEITAEQAAALGATPITGIEGDHQPVRGVDTPTRFAPSPATTARTARNVRPGPGQLTRIRLALSSAELAYARGDKGSADAIVTALRAQIDYDRRYEAIQEDLIRRHVGDAKKHASILERLRNDEAAALNRIASIEQERAQAIKDAAEKRKQAAEEARRAAAQAYRDGLSIREKQLEIARQRAALTEATTADDRKALIAEIAFDKQRIHDMKLDKAERLDYVSKSLALQKELQDMDHRAASLGKQVEAQVLSELATILSKFSPNAYPQPSETGGGSGKTDTHLYDIKHELRRQTPLLRGVRNLFPASEYAVTAAGAVAG